MQKDAGKNKMDCFFVQCPTLKQLNNTYGNEIAEIWLTTQLSDLNDYAMVKEEMNTTHYDMLPDQIVDKYGFLKLTEILLFFYVANDILKIRQKATGSQPFLQP